MCVLPTKPVPKSSFKSLCQPMFRRSQRRFEILVVQKLEINFDVSGAWNRIATGGVAVYSLGDQQITRDGWIRSKSENSFDLLSSVDSLSSSTSQGNQMRSKFAPDDVPGWDVCKNVT